MSRIGFHYFPDTLHYRQSDAERWLPELVSLGAGWLILKSDTRRAIPEAFLRTVLQAGIQPVVHFDSSLVHPPVAEDLAQVINSYGSWGVKHVIFFDRPNSPSVWSAAGWSQQNLVDRFLDRLIPLANLAMETGITPVFPPLEPGGGFWDTSFLRLALQGLKNRHQVDLLKNIALSAYGWSHLHSLNWGSGGSERWMEARPYVTPTGCQDQRGFHIFDWYLEIAADFLPNDPHCFLLQAGQPGDPSRSQTVDFDTLQYDEYCIAHLLFDETIHDPTAPHRLLDPIPSEVQAGFFWLLSADSDTSESSFSWFKPDGQPNPSARMLRNWLQTGVVGANQLIPTPQPGNPDHPITRYVLLPSYEWGVADWHLEAIRPYVKKYQPTVGFSPSEAALAAEVLVIATEEEIPEEILSHLRTIGCKVERIQENGISLASILAER